MWVNMDYWGFSHMIVRHVPAQNKPVDRLVMMDNFVMYETS